MKSVMSQQKIEIEVKPWHNMMQVNITLRSPERINSPLLIKALYSFAMVNAKRLGINLKDMQMQETADVPKLELVT